MTHYPASVLAALATALAGAAAVSPAAVATATTVTGGQGCVTTQAFDALLPGVSAGTVSRILGDPGLVIDRQLNGKAVIVTRAWDACTDFGAVNLVFTNGRLSSKVAVF